MVPNSNGLILGIKFLNRSSGVLSNCAYPSGVYILSFGKTRKARRSSLQEEPGRTQTKGANKHTGHKGRRQEYMNWRCVSGSSRSGSNQ